MFKKYFEKSNQDVPTKLEPEFELPSRTGTEEEHSKNRDSEGKVLLELLGVIESGEAKVEPVFNQQGKEIAVKITDKWGKQLFYSENKNDLEFFLRVQSRSADSQ